MLRGKFALTFSASPATLTGESINY